MDFYSGTVIEEQDTIEEAGERLLKLVLDIASRSYTKVETMRYRGPTQMYPKDPPF